MADTALTQIKNIICKIDGDSDIIAQAEDEVQFNEALLAWASKDCEFAKFLMKNLNRRLENNKENTTRISLLPEVLRTLGNWMFELKSESSSMILNKYLKKSTQIYEENSSQFIYITDNHNFHLKSLEMESRVTEAYASLANFCDDQYMRGTYQI